MEISINRPEGIAQDFVILNRRLTAAGTPQEWEPAVEELHSFITGLEQVIKVGDIDQVWDSHSIARIFGILMTVLAEAGQYRIEGFVPNPERYQDVEWRQIVDREYLPKMGQLRKRAADVSKLYLMQPVFSSIFDSIEADLFPLIDGMDHISAPDRYMPFRLNQVGNIVERLYWFYLRTTDPRLIGHESDIGLLRAIYSFKYLRFGTSGVRGVWQREFTEKRARQVVQAICEFLRNVDVPKYVGADDLSGRKIVIGFDSRRNAQTVAEWAAEVCLANGFNVDIANRDTPTPALVFYQTDYLPKDQVAGLINLTASHNPPQWQGIKFNPRQGWPAPTNVTDFIAARINEINLLGIESLVENLDQAREEGRLQGFDPLDKYVRWVLESGNDNQRIAINPGRMRDFYQSETVVIDEMHGASRGYLTRLLGEIGIRHTVIHAERDPDLPGLDYANPEEPFISQLEEAVRDRGAILGVGMDTDADRFGIVDRGGIYFRPNQILPMLVKYLGIDRSIKGRVIATQTGSPLLEVLAGNVFENEENTPEPGVIPAYVDHPFYHRRVGNREAQIYKNTFMVPVGIKYIEEQRRTNRRYKGSDPLPANWRDVILIGGEESSGLTTKGHVTDKDGVWANLLIMDMLAYYGCRSENPRQSISEIWKETCTFPGCWFSFGGNEHSGSNTGRTDIDAILEVKEELINYYLDSFHDGKLNKLADLDIVYSGGVRYDLVEIRLRDSFGDDRHYLRIRASGTEPINRIYIESSSSAIAKSLMEAVLGQLEKLTIAEIQVSKSEWKLAEILAVTATSAAVYNEIECALKTNSQWSAKSLSSKLGVLVATKGLLENRNKRIARQWMAMLDKM